MTITPQPQPASMLTRIYLTALIMSGLLSTVAIITVVTRYPGVIELELSREKGYVKIDGRSE